MWNNIKSWFGQEIVSLESVLAPFHNMHDDLITYLDKVKAVSDNKVEQIKRLQSEIDQHQTDSLRASSALAHIKSILGA